MFSLQSVIRLSLSCSLGLGLLLLTSFIYSSPLQTHPQLVVHRRLESIPDGYVQAGIANSSETIKLSIGLQSLNMTGLKKRLYEVSMPNSPLYGKHLTKDETEDHVRPHVNATNGLNQWLSVNGIAPKTSSPTGNHVSLEVTIGQAQRLLNTLFYVYNHTATNQSIIRTDQYSVPESMNETIVFIHPTLHFPSKPSQPKSSPGRTRITLSPPLNATLNRRQSCNFQQISVNCILELYNIPADIGVPATNQRTGIFSILGESIQGVDTAKFLGQWRPDVPIASIDLDILSVDGGDNPQSSTVPTSEANLDSQMILGVMPSTKVTTLAVGGGDLSTMLNAVLALDSEHMPLVISTSYGSNEADLPLEPTQFTCNAIMQYTARGGTVIAASGDGGVSGGEAKSCTIFDSVFPPSCPWVLSVGGTDASSGVEVALAETSGGFSNLFAREDYQDNAVRGYLNQLGSQNEGLYNPNGRGIPDVSALALNIITQDQGNAGLTGGTSAAAPIVAAIISGINQKRASNGQSSLGFVNPALYNAASAFTDITQGSNPGCNTNGFPAKAGWDPVTGLGSPNFLELVSSL